MASAIGILEPWAQGRAKCRYVLGRWDVGKHEFQALVERLEQRPAIAHRLGPALIGFRRSDVRGGQFPQSAREKGLID